MSNITQRNSQSHAPLIERNSGDNLITVRNNLSEKVSRVPVGTILLGKYVVKNNLEIKSGEADICVCEYGGAEYVAKIYKDKNTVKPEILEKLKSLDSPYVAKIYETGEYEGMAIVILHYYKLGSLQGKTFSLQHLKQMIIPCVNDALHALHNAGILHKDLKPANIMLLSNGKGVALIDFGISSVLDSNASMIITKRGWTLAYASPEALRDTYFEESDYYSFGVTLYELFCGHNPYENLKAEEVARYLAIQKLPYPEDMPSELKDLITALTYNDLTNRNDPDNPNRRWTYAEVKNWLDGKKQPIPGEAHKAKNFDGAAYKFDGKSYDNVSELVPALAANWAEGKKHLTRRLLSSFFSRYDSEIANNIIDSEEEIQRGADSDLVFWRLLYKLAPDSEEFFWKGRNYSSLEKFGQEMLAKLRRSNASDKSFWDEIINRRLLSQYLEIHSQPKEIVAAVKSLESTNVDRKDDRKKYYLAAYFLTGKKELLVGDKKFSTAENLAKYMNALLDDSAEAFEEFCFNLIDSDNNLNEEFEAWLIALGKRNELQTWKQNLTA